MKWLHNLFRNNNKEYFKDFYSYGDIEDTKECKKFVPK